MRSTFAIFSVSMLLLGGIPASAADLSPDALAQRGIDSYRAARYQAAANDLNAATQAFVSSDQMQKYVETGKFENLGRLETALVYLALAESKLGHDTAAHDAILRLNSAERIEPLYASLPLQTDAADFEALVKRVAPGTALGPNTYLARGSAPAAATTQVAQATPPSTAMTPAPTTPAPPPATTTPAAPVSPTTAQALKPAPAPPLQTAQGTTASPETDRERYIEQRLAEERVKIEKAAEERMAAERVASQRELEERIRIERAAARKSADEQIAAAQKNAQLQIEAAQKTAQEQIAAAQRDAGQRVAAAQKGTSRTDHLAMVREADSLAIKGKLESARRMYAVVAYASDAGRDVLMEAAIGLYRTSGFRDAVNAFRRAAPFAKGEEDLRYYNAVALYESGDYTDAKKEFDCALPYIERSDEVTRYQAKIDLTGTE